MVDLNHLVESIFTILLACVIGSVIGWERESRNRPAGLRTYALVCMGSALVMITSFSIFEEYHTVVNSDPARLGAQVISGIGFLGAGTIIRDKFSVKGLTTAASLWVVACIGLAIGSGMYLTSMIISIVVYYILHNLRCMEDIKAEKMNYEILIRLKEENGQIKAIHKIMDKYEIVVRDINIVYGQTSFLEEDNDDINIVIHAMILDHFIDKLIVELSGLSGVVSLSCGEE
ncbi:MAG: MgtC/SapB family protein [Vallitaleaceae bacterium]|nr:MgtC/SapB family protein [Vallitaleaceae bacterium]